MDSEFTDKDSARGEIDGSVNVIGSARYVGQRFGSGEGGNPEKGNLDQTLPTGVMAKGNDVRSSDVFLSGERKETSFAKNQSKMRERGRRG